MNSKKELTDASKAESWENGKAPTKSDNKVILDETWNSIQPFYCVISKATYYCIN